jgi:microfibrillar-associated protein 1
MDDRFDNRRYYNEDTFGIQSTAGAVPIKNKKGEITMQKVKVQRYISGKRPDYAAKSDSESESEEDSEEDFTEQQQRRPRVHEHSHRRHHDSDDDEGEDQEEGVEFSRRGVDSVKQEPMQDSSDPRIRRLMAAKQRFLTPFIK